MQTRPLESNKWETSLKKLLFLSLLTVVGCSLDSPLCRLDLERWEPTNTVHGIGVVGECTLEEACALSAVKHALGRIKAEYPDWATIDPMERKGVLFVRSPEQRVPKMCKVCLSIYRKCAERWVDYPNIYSSEPKCPDQGYRGLCEDDGNLYVFHFQTGTDTFPKLLGVLSHEWACHEAARLDHGPECRVISLLTRKRALEFVKSLPECACCRD